MKRIIALSILAVLLLAVYSCKSKRVKGNKNIVQKEISISEYDKIEISQPVDVFYTQNDSVPAYLKVEIDSNLIEHLELTVSGTSLKVKAKKEIHLAPTKFIVHTNSKDLKEVSIGGIGNLTGKGKLKTSNLNVAIAGSGNITFDSLEVYSTNAKIAGSGNVTLKGTATKSSYSIAGSGYIYAKELVQDTVQCKIAGSGDIEVNAREELKNSIAGSGDIKYVGNPKVSNSIGGSGNIKQID